jgi:hypothetical protein
MELGRAGRHGHVGRILARRSLRVPGTRPVLIAPRWTKRAQARLGRKRPAIRVRFRAAGGRREVVLKYILGGAAVRPRR